MNDLMGTLLEFVANVVTVLGSSMGSSLTIGALIFQFNGYRGYSAKLLLIAVVSSVAAGTVLAFIDIQENKHNLLLVCVLAMFAIFQVAVGLWAFVLPMRIARERKHGKIKLIVLLNLLILVPFSWHLALWLATKKQVGNQVSRVIEQEGDSAEYKAVLTRAMTLLGHLQDSHQSKAAAKIRAALHSEAAPMAFVINLEKVLDRLLFDFEFSDEIADEVRGLGKDIQALQMGNLQTPN